MRQDKNSVSMAEALRRAMHDSMQHDDRVLCFGLGVTDPKGVFDTTTGLESTFGSSRVFDVPVSENALTGMALGLALKGYKPVLTHQRVDFSLVSMDQLVNNVAKWYYMFGGRRSVSLVVRMVIGRGWGQGPTHSQSFHSLFAHIPGLKVFLPSSPNDAYHGLRQAIDDPNPVLLLEHRWLHGARGEISDQAENRVLDKACVVREGVDATVIALSSMVPEALRAAKFLSEKKISIEVIDLRSARPIDWEPLRKSVAKTGQLICVDISHAPCSVASEIIAGIAIEGVELAVSPRRIANPNRSAPTSYFYTKDYYSNWMDIVRAIDPSVGAQELNAWVAKNEGQEANHDVPDKYFLGPF